MLNFLKDKLRHLNFLRKVYWKIRNLNPILLFKKFKIKSSFSDEKFFINIGGFIFLKKDWRVIEYVSEYYPLSEYLIDYNIDLSKKPILPIEDNMVDLVYSSHTYEHILLENALANFKEVYRIMKKDGIFRIVVPDMNLVWNELKNNNTQFLNYVGKLESESPLEFLLNYFAHGREVSESAENDFLTYAPTDFFQKYELKAIVDEENHSFENHIGWFNYEKLKNLLVEVGFSENKIYRSEYLCSVSNEMRDPKFFDQTIPKASLFVECIK